MTKEQIAARRESIVKGMRMIGSECPGAFVTERKERPQPGDYMILDCPLPAAVVTKDTTPAAILERLNALRRKLVETSQ